MLKFNATTPVKFYARESDYTPGTGSSTNWALVESGDLSTFYVEWVGSFGDRALSAQALGVNDSATLRTHYVPAVYEKMRSVQVLVIKNADASAVVEGEPVRSNPNVYEVWGGADNVREANQFMEFRVRRYEGL